MAPPVKCEVICAHHRPVLLSWAKLIKRVLEIDIAHGQNRSGALQISSAILEQPVIEKVVAGVFDSSAAYCDAHLVVQGSAGLTG